MMNHPKFISTQPTGQDLYEGHSQERIAKAIAAHIRLIDDNSDSKNNSVPRIIGIEGQWGIGKSNVIKYLDENELKESDNNKYYFFNYDAWGHQEDLQRRSILELLTNKLIEEKILSGRTEMLVFDEKVDEKPEKKNCTWQEKLSSLVAKKSYTRTLTRPSVFNSTKFFGLALLFTGMMPTVINAMGLKEDLGSLGSLWCLCIMLSPLILFFLVMLIFVIRGKASFKEMWSMYNTSAQTNATSYSISELEPSVKEFSDWMKDISNGLPENKRLVIVFDNMDRLPQDKVKTLWSSIHTLFTGKDYPNIWCIIPYDRGHIFNQENNNDEISQFIDKLFPVVYRVPAPVISDYKVVFDKFWDMAFGDVRDITSDQRDTINRIYRKKHPSPNTRQIVTYVNKVVSLYNMWRNEVSVEAIALYAVDEQGIINNPEANILSSAYIKDYNMIIPDTEALKTEISALVYGVSKEFASQLPLKNYIKSCLSSGKGDMFVEYAKSNALFFIILEDEINSLGSELVESASIVMNLLSISDFSQEQKKTITRCWDRLAKGYMPINKGNVELRDVEKLLIKNSNKECAQLVAQNFVTSLNLNETIEGSAYYNAYYALDDFLRSCNLDLVEKPSKIVNPEFFLSYLKTAKRNYNVYPVSCNATDFSNSCAMWINQRQDYVFSLDLLKDDKAYSFDDYLQKVEDVAASDELTIDNVDNVIKSMNILYVDYPLYSNTSIDVLSVLFPSMSVAKNTSYYDVWGILISVGQEPAIVSDEFLSKIATSIIENSLNSEMLIDAALKYKTVSLNRVLEYSINNNIISGKIEDSSLLPQLEVIKSQTTSSCENILNYLDSCKYHLSKTDKANGIENYINTMDWYEACVASETTLTEEILEWFYECLSVIPENELVNANRIPQTNKYWFIALDVLIDSRKFANNLPQNIKNVTGNIILAIADGNISSIENTIYEKLLNNVTYDDISSYVNEALIDFCNNRKSMTPAKFIMLHKWIEFDLRNNNTHHIDFLNQCLGKVIDDPQCQSLICQEKELYQSMIQNHLKHASSILQKVKSTQDSDSEDYPNKEFKQFMDSIKIED
ncbi:MAG: KAP family NTPase [Paludibacteraceae bacterium]|nr:KAP family NTPase [Paludibacteraceae bacterium]